MRLQNASNISTQNPFRSAPGSRREAYLAEEKEFMLSLPKRPYEPSVWKQQPVGNDYLISDGINKYSVPFDLIGEQVQIRLTKDLVEVYFKCIRMTSHRRLETSPPAKLYQVNNSRFY